MEIHDFKNKKGLRTLIENIQDGRVVAFHMMGVCGLLADGAHTNTWNEIERIKKSNKVRTLIGFHKTILKLDIIDSQKIHRDLHRILQKKPRSLSSIVSGKAHILYPIQEKAVTKVPLQMQSYDNTHGHMVQVFEAEKTDFEPIIKELHNIGIFFPTVTSLNLSGQGSIVNLEEGIQFSKKCGGIPQFLIGNPSSRTGSFGRIHGVSLSVLREGPEIPKVLHALSRK